MLNITNSQNAAAAVGYFRGSLAEADYYAGEVAGVWHGQGAARLGLIGTVEGGMFERLLMNIDPRTGKRLTAVTRDDRRPGSDFTFNAPKGVSLAHALTGDARILGVFRQAVVDTMREVERDAKTRVRAGGRDDDRVTGNLCWAEFLHTTGRPVDGVPDPHLHIHAYVVNATWDAREQKWKALQWGDIKGEGAYYEAAFLARLAHGMKGLGYGIERRGRFWDISGLPDSLTKEFSRRTAVIETRAKELGLSSAEAKAGLGKMTRERKTKELSPDACRREWQTRAGRPD
jgi:conjugative relaxase-like TrwC/TraI family protein